MFNSIFYLIPFESISIFFIALANITIFKFIKSNFSFTSVQIVQSAKAKRYSLTNIFKPNLS